MMSYAPEVKTFETTFDDIFNEAFNSYQPVPSEHMEVEVQLNSIVDDALNRFEKYCLENRIPCSRKIKGDNMVVLTVKRS